jgi:hypothetical protein
MAPDGLLESVLPAQLRLHNLGWLLVTAITVVAMALGAIGTIGYQHFRSYIDAIPTHAPTAGSATNAQAAGIDGQLVTQMTVVVFSPQDSDGHANTEGDLARLVESYGGMLLSFTQDSSGTNVAEVMLGLVPLPGVALGPSYPVRCYRYAFANDPSSVQQPTRIPCPAHRTDGRPGSVRAQMGQLLAVSPVYPAQPSAGYPLNASGAEEFLAKSWIAGKRLSPPPALSSTSGGGVFAAAFQYHGACFFLRMSNFGYGSAPEQDQDLWLAPAVDQTAGGCAGGHALASSMLYGSNPS